MTALPVLYSFRRCPYAMRARMAVLQSGEKVELREILLRDKPEEMVRVSPKATVPVLVLADGTVVDESLDVAKWALGKNDPEQWLPPDPNKSREMFDLIALFDGKFKHHLDHTKYATRHAAEDMDVDAYSTQHRKQALTYLEMLEEILSSRAFLNGERKTLADVAIAPFIRQFVNTDTDWFDAQDLPAVQQWLKDFLESDLFQAVMQKYPVWNSGTTGEIFGRHVLE